MGIHTLLKKALALGAGFGVAEILLTGHSILADAHDKHITILELGGIAKLLDTVSLSMDGILTVSASTTPTAKTIRCNTDDFATVNKHGYMKAGAIRLTHPTSVGV
jgi:hypothetical protein